MHRKNTFTIYKRIFKYALKGFYIVVPSLIFMALLIYVSNLGPRITKYIIDDVLQSSLDINLKQKMLIKSILIYVLVVVITIILRYVVSIFNSLSEMKLEKDIRYDCMDKLSNLPISYFDNEPDGKIVTRIDTDVNGIRNAYGVFVNLLESIITLVIVYFNMYSLDKKLSLYVLIVVPFLLIWITVFRKVAFKIHYQIREIRSKINAKINEIVIGVSVIQVFNQEDKMMEEYNSLVTDINKKQYKSAVITASFGWELLLLGKRLLVSFIVCYFGILVFKTDGVITIGLIYAYTKYIDSLAEPLNEVFNNLNNLEDAMVASSRVFDFLDLENDILDGDSFYNLKDGSVTFNNLDFSYIKGIQVLKNINLKVNSGEKIGLIGATGSGKSSLMNIICRFYEFEGGEVLIDDLDIRSFNKKNYRKNIGIILQTPTLFRGTLKYNITLGEDYSDEVVIDVLDKIGASFILKKDKLGLYQEIEFKGDNLSVGEKQLICFARILLKDPKILILDEATANIDTETEIKIKNAIDILTYKRTTFIVAHRLSTIKDADKIVVLNKGEIVGIGNHTKLYETSSIYKKMYDAQNTIS